MYVYLNEKYHIKIYSYFIIFYIMFSYSYEPYNIIFFYILYTSYIFMYTRYINILLRVHMHIFKYIKHHILRILRTRHYDTYQNFIWRGAGILHQNMYHMTIRYVTIFYQKINSFYKFFYPYLSYYLVHTNNYIYTHISFT